METNQVVPKVAGEVKVCEVCKKPLTGKRRRFCCTECTKSSYDAERLKANNGHLCVYICQTCGKVLQLGRKPKQVNPLPEMETAV